MARRRDDDDLAGGEEARGGDGRRIKKGDNEPGAGQLRAFIERIERLEEEKQTIADDIKDVYGEAKGTGFDTQAIRKIIRIRKQDRNERMEQESILNTYLSALGMPLLGDD